VSVVPRRVLVIGLDGATFRLVEPWVAAGELPEIARLMAAGRHGVLESTLPPLTPPAWTSFMTGKNPGKHGVFGFRHPAGAAYESGDVVTTRSIRARTLWEIVGEAGRTVGAINVVPSYPVRPVNGFMVTCMLAPPGETNVVHPPELRALLGDDYQAAVKPPQRLMVDDPDYAERALAYIRDLRRLAERRLQVTLRLMDAMPCDLLTVILYEPDRLQHFFWRHLSGDGPGGAEPAAVAAIRAEARALYRFVDESVGALVRAAGSDTATLLVSDHGFGPAPERLVSMNRYLADHGWLCGRRNWRWRRRVVRTLPERLRRRYETVEHVYVDWRRSQAWCEILETRCAGIWLNVRGRQHEGRVAPGAEYEGVRDELARELALLEEDDQRVFERVARREEVYRGPYVEAAPDLLLYTTPRFGFRLDALRVEMRHAATFSEFVEQGLTGAHDPHGLYVAAGPGIVPGGRGAPAPIEALAPTILRLLGLPVPDGMDAEPLRDLLTPAAAAALTVRYEPDRDPAPTAPDGWESDADQAQVEAQLRALGYVE
jgi:predicted AlkP superfamily phosphohydrolase/phosphomutase